MFEGSYGVVFEEGDIILISNKCELELGQSYSELGEGDIQDSISFVKEFYGKYGKVVQQHEEETLVLVSCKGKEAYLEVYSLELKEE
tara:strand:+ start:675 stop:935 length:261 start_codon:yes stop_codon:yes gene_type:complete